ncbi:MAG TPA: hypothetical protein VHC95_01745 [Opitutales bacterium]|nr:hypothetical protein [Opitutales bacterium]
MRRTWKHNLNRWFRRRGSLPRSARVPRATYSPMPRQGAFTRSRFGRHEVTLNWQRWLWRAGFAGLAAAALWMAWQSWLGLGIFSP